MEVLLNTLYIVTRGATLRRDHLTLCVEVERQIRLTVPIHQLESVAVFGGVHVMPAAMALCAERGVAVAFLTESGRLLGRVDAPGSGNVLLRREQFRKADRPEERLRVARNVVAGKLQNARNNLLRAGREGPAEASNLALHAAAGRLADALATLPSAPNVDAVRGHEGDAARVYFEAFPSMVRQQGEAFKPLGRTRRPPRDRMNALLSFLYGLLVHDCSAALTAAGLDPCVGFLHVDRPGRPGLSLDLMEEFRPLLADRVALTLVNRQQVKAEGFEERDGGEVAMREATLRAVLAALPTAEARGTNAPLSRSKGPLRAIALLAGAGAGAVRAELPHEWWTPG